MDNGNYFPNNMIWWRRFIGNYKKCVVCGRIPTEIYTNSEYGNHCQGCTPLKEGDNIEMTWLPPPINHPRAINAYIGMSGYVRDLSSDGSFLLQGKTASLIVSGKPYSFKRL